MPTACRRWPGRRSGRRASAPARGRRALGARAERARLGALRRRRRSTGNVTFAATETFNLGNGNASLEEAVARVGDDPRRRPGDARDRDRLRLVRLSVRGPVEPGDVAELAARSSAERNRARRHDRRRVPVTGSTLVRAAPAPPAATSTTRATPATPTALAAFESGAPCSTRPSAASAAARSPRGRPATSPRRTSSTCSRARAQDRGRPRRLVGVSRWLEKLSAGRSRATSTAREPGPRKAAREARPLGGLGCPDAHRARRHRGDRHLLALPDDAALQRPPQRHRLRGLRAGARRAQLPVRAGRDRARRSRVAAAARMAADRGSRRNRALRHGLLRGRPGRPGRQAAERGAGARPRAGRRSRAHGGRFGCAAGPWRPRADRDRRGAHLLLCAADRGRARILPRRRAVSRLVLRDGQADDAAGSCRASTTPSTMDSTTAGRPRCCR